MEITKYKLYENRSIFKIEKMNKNQFVCCQFEDCKVKFVKSNRMLLHLRTHVRTFLMNF